MTHARVNHLWTTGGRSVAQAVSVSAQMRSALDDVERRGEVGLLRVVAVLDIANPWIVRYARTRVSVIGLSADPPVVGQLPNGARHSSATFPTSATRVHVRTVVGRVDRDCVVSDFEMSPPSALPSVSPRPAAQVRMPVLVLVSVLVLLLLLLLPGPGQLT
jgi:hypothetical protein